MKKIILDCGSHLGESVKKFRNLLPNNELEFHMFEPNPFLFEIFDQDFEFKDCNKYNNAVTIKNEKVKLYGCMSRKLGVGSTLEKSKANFDGYNEDDFLEIEGIDLVEFINNFSDDDYLILKLDVEGAEYEILEKLIETGTIKKVKEFFCEFHTQWLDPSFIGREQNIRQKLSEINLPIFYWDAL